MAEYMGTSEEEIVAAIGLGSAYQPRSLNSVYVSPSEGWESHEELQDLVGATDDRLEAIVEFKSLYDALNDLDERKHQIIRRRYFEQWSQSEVARELGISQMHVCRLEHEALDQLRGAIGQEVPLAG
jgi:RNA polymerase sigma-B factor